MSNLQSNISKSNTIIEKRLKGKLKMDDIHKLELLINKIEEEVKDTLEVDSEVNDYIDGLLKIYYDTLNEVCNSIIENNYLWLLNFESEIDKISEQGISQLFLKLASIEKGIKKHIDIEDDGFKNKIIDKIFEKIKNKFNANIEKLIINISEFFKIDNCKTIFEYIDKIKDMKFISDSNYKILIKALLEKLIENEIPEINEIKNNVLYKLDIDLNPDMDTCSLDIDITEDLKQIKDKINSIKNNIEGGDNLEENLIELTKKIEDEIFNKLGELLTKYLEIIINPEIELIENSNDLNEYENHSNKFKVFSNQLERLKEINHELAEKISKKYLGLKKIIYTNILLKIHSIKTTDDIVDFGGKKFPRFLGKKQKPHWKIIPQINGENIVFNIKESKTGNLIVPSDEKRLRLDNPYEVSRDSYNKILGLLKKIKQNSKVISEMESYEDNLSEKNLLTLEKLKAENKNLQEDNLLYIFKVIKTLNKMGINNYGSVPKLSEKIIITKYIISNLNKLIELCESQLMRQDGIGILEGEAGVGKNVLIDIFANFTNRPVFIFPCNKRTSKDDLTYEWLIDQNGTYKLHSKVYNAIKTPGSILVFDEINTLPIDVIKLLNGLFDYRRTLFMSHDNEHQKADESSIILATQNPTNYIGTEELPQDTSSRSNVAIINYPLLETKVGEDKVVQYDEALITYMNFPYFYKFYDENLVSLEDIKNYKLIIMKKQSGHELSKAENEIVDTIEYNKLQSKTFVSIWNNVMLLGNDDEIEKNYGEEVVEGMYDIYKILKMASYIRKRYRKKQTGVNLTDPISRSVSQRDLNNMMEKLCMGTKPLDAFKTIYLGSIPNLISRKVIEEDIDAKFNK